MFDNIIKFTDSFITDYKIPYNSFILYHKGKCICRHDAGFSDYNGIVPATGKEKMNIYSCSKMITCAAAMKLYEDGLFKLDDPLYAYIPEFKDMYVKDDNGVHKAQSFITIRNLFTMTAGFNYNLESDAILKAKNDTDGKCPTVETIKYLSEQPLDFEPGDRYQYSLGHDVLASVVEVISGERFGSFVKKNIFDVLGMDNTTYYKPDFELDTLSAQYQYNSESDEFINVGKGNQFRFGDLYESGGAGCVSTADDYIKFAEAMRVGDIILKKSTIDLMATNQLTDHSIRTFIGTDTDGYGFSWYGYGLGIRCPRNHTEITDFGWDGAAGSYFMVDRANEFTFFYGQHVLSSPNWEARYNMRQIVTDTIKSL